MKKTPIKVSSNFINESLNYNVVSARSNLKDADKKAKPPNKSIALPVSAAKLKLS